MTNKISVLVVSCDKYSDLWPVFFNGYFKYWHDLKMPLYLGSNFKKYTDKRVGSILIGNDKDYASNLLKMLGEIKTEYVIIFTEDLFISSEVNSFEFNKYIESFMERKGIYLKLVRSYPLASSVKDEPIGNVNKSSRYRIGIAAAIWEKKWLETNLQTGMDAWELEKTQSGFSNIPEDLAFSINKNYNGPLPFEWVHGVIKGVWCRGAIEYLKKEGFSSIIKGRKVQPISQYLYVEIYRLTMWIFIKIGFVWKK
jgi:hypothetical protein